jgi:hypothetical protein
MCFMSVTFLTLIFFLISVYEYYKRLDLLLNICQQSNVLKNEVDCSKKEKLCSFQEKVKMLK